MKLRFKDPTISYLLLILVVLAVGFELFLPGRKFLNISNFQSMAFQVPELGLLAIGMMVAMLTGSLPGCPSDDFQRTQSLRFQRASDHCALGGILIVVISLHHLRFWISRAEA